MKQLNKKQSEKLYQLVRDSKDLDGKDKEGIEILLIIEEGRDKKRK